MQKYSFKVQWYAHDELIKLSLSNDEGNLIRNEMEILKEQRQPKPCSFYNMCDFNSLHGICKKIVIKALKDFLKQQDDALLGDGWENEIEDTLKQPNYPITIQFPLELNYPPFIFWQYGYLTMKDCLLLGPCKKSLSEIAIDRKDVVTFEKYFKEFWRDNKYFTIAKQKKHNFSNTNTILADHIFMAFDAPVLYSMVIQHNEREEKTSIYESYDDYFSYDIIEHYNRRKDGHIYFGISVSEEGKSRSLIRVPQFCEQARIALYYRFIAKPAKAEHVNTLHFQLSPIQPSDAESKSDGCFTKRFSPSDAWYYEMCTGISLSLIISSLLLDLDIIRLYSATPAKRLRQPAGKKCKVPPSATW